MNIPANFFIFIDIFFGIIYFILIIIGYKRGFLFELISLLYSFISILVSWFLAPILANVYPIVNINNLNKETEIITKVFDLSTVINTLIYFVIVFLLLKLLYIILAFVLKGMNKIPVIGKFNQILGIFAGIFNATLITLALSMLLSLPLFKNGEQVKNQTVFKYISNYSDKLLNYIVENTDFENIKLQFNNFDINNARQEFKNWIELKNNNE